MIEKKTWAEFRKTGLLLFINSFLHIFGWAIVVEINDETNEEDCYPARCKFRGFDETSQTEAYKRVSEYMVNNAPDLLKECD